jgi:hypothetical protein
MIHTHPNVITATEIHLKGSTGIVDEVLRFGSLQEMLDYFNQRGVPASALETVRNSVDSTGTATLTLLEQPKASG